MQKAIQKKVLSAALVLSVLPGLGWAQDQKDKEKEKEKSIQTIVITRKGDMKEKTVIEIDGDKVKVNGKDSKDQTEVNVNVNTMKPGIMRHKSPEGSWTMAFDDDRISLFDEDENRAMLGVVTEGNDKGAEIKSVTKESAAEKAGLKKGDILTKIGEKKIESTDDVTEAIRSKKPGEKVNITYLRDNKEQKISAELGKWKGIRMNAVGMPRMPEIPRVDFNMEGMSAYGFAGRPRLGLSIQDTDDGKGVKVLDVDDDSHAAKAGIKKDDLLLSIDDKEIKSTEDVTRTMRENREKSSFNFKINRGGKTENVEVKIPKKLKTADL